MAKVDEFGLDFVNYLLIEVMRYFTDILHARHMRKSYFILSELNINALYVLHIFLELLQQLD